MMLEISKETSFFESFEEVNGRVIVWVNSTVHIPHVQKWGQSVNSWWLVKDDDNNSIVTKMVGALNTYVIMVNGVGKSCRLYLWLICIY